MCISLYIFASFSFSKLIYSAWWCSAFVFCYKDLNLMPKVCVWSSLQFPWGKPLYRVASSDVKGTSASTGTKTKLDKYENKYDKQRSDCRVQRYEWIMAGPGRWCHGGAPHGWFSPLIIVFKYLYLPSPAQPSPAQPSQPSPAQPSPRLTSYITIQ